MFLTLEDETGLAQVTVPETVYAACGSALFAAPCLVITGRAARRGAGNILLAIGIHPLC